MKTIFDFIHDEGGHVETPYAIRMAVVVCSLVALLTSVQEAALGHSDRPLVHLCFSGLLLIASLVFWFRYTIDGMKSIEPVTHGALVLIWICCSLA